MTKEEMREVAHEAAKEAVRETFKPLGVDIDNADSYSEFTDDMRYLRRQRKGSEELGKWVRRSAVWVAIPAVLYALWEGFRHAFMRGPNP